MKKKTKKIIQLALIAIASLALVGYSILPFLFS